MHLNDLSTAASVAAYQVQIVLDKLEILTLTDETHCRAQLMTTNHLLHSIRLIAEAQLADQAPGFREALGIAQQAAVNMATGAGQ